MKVNEGGGAAGGGGSLGNSRIEKHDGKCVLRVRPNFFFFSFSLRSPGLEADDGAVLGALNMVL